MHFRLIGADVTNSESHMIVSAKQKIWLNPTYCQEKDKNSGLVAVSKALESEHSHLGHFAHFIRVR